MIRYLTFLITECGFVWIKANWEVKMEFALYLL